MKNFMLIARSKENSDRFADADDRERFLKVFQQWSESLRERGSFVSSGQLSALKKRVETNGGPGQIFDGPFPETKEALTGYFLLAAAGLDDATRMAQECPVLRFDHLEIYEIV